MTDETMPKVIFVHKYKHEGDTLLEANLWKSQIMKETEYIRKDLAVRKDDNCKTLLTKNTKNVTYDNLSKINEAYNTKPSLYTGANGHDIVTWFSEYQELLDDLLMIFIKNPNDNEQYPEKPEADFSLYKKPDKPIINAVK